MDADDLRHAIIIAGDGADYSADGRHVDDIDDAELIEIWRVTGIVGWIAAGGPLDWPPCE